MKSTTALTLISLLVLTSHALSTPTKRNLVFALSTEANGQGRFMSWVVDRWKCKNLADDDLDKQASWAFVEAGLANGCTLYDDSNCAGAYVNVEKNNGNILGPGPVNLTDIGFDDRASSFSCY